MLPDELDDRAQDVWEPLLAIADLAGGDWPTRARAAAIALSTSEEREDNSLTARVIADIWRVFSETGETRLRTADLIDELAKIEESTWADWHEEADHGPRALQAPQALPDQDDVREGRRRNRPRLQAGAVR